MPGAGVTVIPPLNWGGEGIEVRVLDESVQIRFKCDRGSIPVPLTTDASGAFDLPGTFSWCPAVCIGDLPARYQGHVTASQLTLMVSWEYKGEQITNGPFVATVGQEPTKLEGPCPICLAGNTLIDTPGGPVQVKDLREGMLVWTAPGAEGTLGSRLLATILKTSRTKVPPDHKMVHLTFADGQNLFASPGHPTADGRLVGNLSDGDFVNGVRVISVDLVPHAEEFTYDILPSGPTGTYWANGILIGSTLTDLATEPWN